MNGCGFQRIVITGPASLVVVDQLEPGSQPVGVFFIARGHLELWDEHGALRQGSCAQTMRWLRTRNAPRCRIASPRQRGLFSLS